MRENDNINYNPEVVYEKFRLLILQYRRDKRLTVNEFSTLIKTPPKSIYRFVDENSSLSMAIILRICNLVNKRFDDIINTKFDNPIFNIDDYNLNESELTTLSKSKNDELIYENNIKGYSKIKDAILQIPRINEAISEGLKQQSCTTNYIAFKVPPKFSRTNRVIHFITIFPRTKGKSVIRLNFEISFSKLKKVNEILAGYTLNTIEEVSKNAYMILYYEQGELRQKHMQHHIGKYNAGTYDVIPPYIITQICEEVINLKENVSETIKILDYASIKKDLKNGIIDQEYYKELKSFLIGLEKSSIKNRYSPDDKTLQSCGNCNIKVFYCTPRKGDFRDWIWIQILGKSEDLWIHIDKKSGTKWAWSIWSDTEFKDSKLTNYHMPPEFNNGAAIKSTNKSGELTTILDNICQKLKKICE